MAQAFYNDTDPTLLAMLAHQYANPGIGSMTNDGSPTRDWNAAPEVTADQAPINNGPETPTMG